jgi:hypothetical protein
MRAAVAGLVIASQPWPLWTAGPSFDRECGLGPAGGLKIVLRELDMWRCAIVRRPAATISQADIDAGDVVWLPPTRPFAFRADPFGMWHGGRLHIFVETFDYRTLKGEIELLVCDGHLNVVHNAVILSRPWHLSYPFVFAADGEIWMLPEARRSGSLTLYRAREFPGDWVEVAEIDVASDAVDSTPLFHARRWWLFYARPASGGGGWELHLAFADRLTGPWQAHPQNPVRTGRADARPAGTPVVRANGWIDLPVQDCTGTYGASVRRLEIRTLDQTHFEAKEFAWLNPSPAIAPYTDGLHTLSAAGEVSLIDCKFVDRSLSANLVRQRGSLARRLRRWRS